MYPIVHSPTLTTFKSKWNTLKEWFTPDLSKRRPSQCSTTSTNTTISTLNSCNCNKEEFFPTHQKRPSLTSSLNDKYMSPFRRRPSNASQSELLQQKQQAQQAQQQKDIEKLFELYHLALDEINYAEDSQGSPYYHGDKIAAQEAIDNCISHYNALADIQNLNIRIDILKSKFENLPQES